MTTPTNQQLSSLLARILDLSPTTTILFPRAWYPVPVETMATDLTPSPLIAAFVTKSILAMDSKLTELGDFSGYLYGRLVLFTDREPGQFEIRIADVHPDFAPWL